MRALPGWELTLVQDESCSQIYELVMTVPAGWRHVFLRFGLKVKCRQFEQGGSCHRFFPPIRSHLHGCILSTITPHKFMNLYRVYLSLVWLCSTLCILAVGNVVPYFSCLHCLPYLRLLLHGSLNLWTKRGPRHDNQSPFMEVFGGKLISICGELLWGKMR